MPRTRKNEHIEHFPCFRHFSKFHPLFSGVLAPVSPQKIEHIEHFPCFRHFSKFHPLFSGVLAPASPQKHWTYWAFPCFRHFFGPMKLEPRLHKSYAQSMIQGHLWEGWGELWGGLEFSHAITAATTQKKEKERETEREMRERLFSERDDIDTHTHTQNKEG